ncbi:retrovirus-related pol polyprotein from transposon TNT 1-94 [Tanacetum coccineum]|uniref:Retrovirus-related pol polyprotein from transposon TNT 1-94 n=1 Tax=Tanacetum coccineum TaxID=301880 RepID=A0ABQ5AG51_9ASTR
MDDRNITIEEYIRLVEEKAQKHGKVFNWETAKYGRTSTRRIQDLDELKDHCLTLKNTSYPCQRYAVYNTLVNEEEPTGFTSIRRIQQEDTTKFVTDVKLAKSLYTTNYDQLYAYLSQHERHANEVRIMCERYPDPLALVANSQTLYNPSQSPQHSDSSLAVPTFQQGKDLTDCINKAMAFLYVVASRFPPSNNQLRTFSNPRNLATIQDGRVTVQQIQGRQTQSFAGTGNRGITTTSRGNYAAGQAKVVKCYNCLGEGHMAKQCTQSKRPRSSAWFKEKFMLAEAQEAAFQTKDLDAYDSDCDDISLAKAVLMTNLLSCDSDVLSELSYSDTFLNDMINQDESQNAGIQDTNSSAPNDLSVLSLVEQMTDHVANLDKENQTNKMVTESLTAELERYKERVAIFEHRLNVDLNKREKLIDSQMDDLIRKINAKFAAQEIDILKETLSNQTVFNQIEAAVDQCSVDKNAFEIQSNLQLICNDEILKQIMSREIVHIAISSVDILNVNKSCVDQCNKCLELETELLKKKAQSQEKDTVIRKLKDKIKSLSRKDSVENVKKDIDEIETKKTLSWVHNLNAQLQEFFFAIAALKNELRKLKGKNIVETAVSKPRATTAPGIKQNPSEPLLESACMFTKHVQELLVYVSKTCPSLMKPTKKLVVVTPMNKDKKVRFAEPDTSLSNIPKQTDSLRTKDSNKPLLTSTGVNTTTSASGSKPIAQSQEKDTIIRKLKDRIKSLSGKDSVDNVKKDIDDIETINIKLEHSVAKLLSENENLRKEREHLKSIYKDQFDSIRKTHVQSKKHRDSLIAQINVKSVENSNLNAQLQEKVFAIAALKNKLRKLKGKNVVDIAVSKPSATIAPGMFKLDIKPISRRLKNNRDAHEVYLEKTIENTDTLHGLELLVYVSKSCPSLTKPTEKLVAVTPMNKDKKVRFFEPVTSSSNIPKQTDSLRTKDSNKPLLTSTGVNTTTSASRSKPSGSTKKNRIS